MEAKSMREHTSWKLTTLGEVANFINGDRGKNYPSSLDRVDYGIPFINTGHIEPTGWLSDERMDYITDEKFNKLGSGKVQVGDIVYCLRGSTIGKTARNKYATGAIASSLIIVRAKENINQDFLYYFLISPIGQSLAKTNDNGSAQPNLSGKVLSQYPLKVPNYEEQCSIAGILNSLDNKIQLNLKINQTIEQMAQALFKSWFVDFDPVIDNALATGTIVSDFPEALQQRAEQRTQAQKLPNFKPLPDDIRNLFSSEFEDTELGWIPKGWAVNSIHDMVDTISKTFKIKEVDEVIFLNTGDIENGKLLHSNYSKTDGLPGQAKKSIAKGDILYSEIRPKNKHFAFVNIDTSDYVVSTKLMVLRAKSDIDPLLPYFILTQEKTIQNLQHVAEHRSGTFPQITYKELADVKAVLPKDNKLVDYFVNNYLKPFYDKQFSSIAQNEQLEKLRDTLLPKLISGEISLSESKVSMES